MLTKKCGETERQRDEFPVWGGTERRGGVGCVKMCFENQFQKMIFLSCRDFSNGQALLCGDSGVSRLRDVEIARSNCMLVYV